MLIVLAAACSAESLQTSSPTPAHDRPALVIEPAPGADFGDETAFTESVAVRYAESMPGAAIAADLRAHGFACEELAPVEARPDYGLFSCTLATPANGCFDTFIVNVRRNPAAEDRATAEGAYARRCLGALPR